MIASFWPEGKGNVGYGANVGSNHTLKAPDQELWPGEGVFFGLGTNIKFPSNFSQAPYSVIATGVMTLPQKVDMPFSLINGASITTSALSPAINEIMPGWVLSSSVFTMLRNEYKFETRNRSSRTTIEFRILRPEIVDMMRIARSRLRIAQGQHKIDFNNSPIYTDKQIPGLGKNYLTEASRVKGIEAYTYFIRHYVYAHVIELVQANPTLSLAQLRITDTHVLKIIQEELGDPTMATILEAGAKSFANLATSAEKGKSRDDKRGAKIIPDYHEVHRHASEEKIVIKAKQKAKEVQELVRGVLGPARARL